MTAVLVWLGMIRAVDFGLLYNYNETVEGEAETDTNIQAFNLCR